MEKNRIWKGIYFGKCSECGKEIPLNGFQSFKGKCWECMVV